VTEGGAAARDGRLRAGDQIISVCYIFVSTFTLYIFYIYDTMRMLAWLGLKCLDHWTE